MVKYIESTRDYVLFPVEVDFDLDINMTDNNVTDVQCIKFENGALMGNCG